MYMTDMFTLSLRFRRLFIVRLFYLLITLFLTSEVATARIIYVKQGANGDGSTWANALPHLQTALAMAVSGDQIWVAAGTYYPDEGTGQTDNDPNAAFTMREGVSLYGGFDGTESSLAARKPVNPRIGQPSGTTLSGDIGTLNNDADNTYRIFNNNQTLTAGTMLDGFVITLARGNNGAKSGGGMYNLNSSPTIRNCTFTDNKASYYGGGMLNENSHPTIINCLFSSNRVDSSLEYGGAIANKGSNPVITACTFSNNYGTYGGAVSNQGSNPRIVNCDFSGNRSSTGGAFYNLNSSNPTVINCTFTGNCCAGGSVINSSSSIASFINCSFAGHSDIAFMEGVSSLTFTNSVFWDNGTALFSNYAGPQSVATVTNSLITGAAENYVSGPDNVTITANPFNPDIYFALLPTSAGIDTGNPDAYTAVNAPLTDIRENARTSGAGCRLDMGAVEYQTGPVITSQPLTGTVLCAGTNLAVPVSASGNIAGYQWYRKNPSGDWTSLGAAQRTATLSLTNVQSADTGDYQVVVSGCPAVTSTTFSLTVNTISSFSVSTATVCTGQMAAIQASGCPGGSIRWPDNSTGLTYQTSAGSSTPVTATCTVGSCQTVATGQLNVVAAAPPTAAIFSLTADESACPVRLTGQATGSSFTFAGPNGYVFSQVYRQGGTYPVSGINLLQTGKYTLTSVYRNQCGVSQPVTQTVTVTRNCP